MRAKLLANLKHIRQLEIIEVEPKLVAVTRLVDYLLVIRELAIDRHWPGILCRHSMRMQRPTDESVRHFT